MMINTEYFILIAAVMLVATIFLYGKSLSVNTTKLLNAFSAAFLIAICFTEILPESYTLNIEYTGLFVIVGFLLQLVLGVFSGGIEHGHSHHHKHGIPYAILFSLGAHAFIEGMPLNAHTHEAHESLHHALITGILIHNVPITIVLTSMLKHSGISNFKTLVILFIFSLLSPLGATVANIIFISPENLAIPLALVAGILLHISTTILFESADSHKFNLVKMGVIILGLAAALLVHH